MLSLSSARDNVVNLHVKNHKLTPNHQGVASKSVWLYLVRFIELLCAYSTTTYKGTTGGG